MTNNLTFARRNRVRALGAAIAVAMLLGGTAACSSDSDADSKSAGDSSAATESKTDDSATESKSGSGQEGRPDGFPDDIPLPEFEKVDTVLPGTDNSGIWSIVVTIDPTMQESKESLIADYTAQLEDAGYEMTETGSINEAENEKWSITFRSAADGTLTIGTSPN